jgi:hypothetical protein
MYVVKGRSNRSRLPAHGHEDLLQILFDCVLFWQFPFAYTEHQTARLHDCDVNIYFRDSAICYTFLLQCLDLSALVKSHIEIKLVGNLKERGQCADVGVYGRY